MRKTLYITATLPALTVTFIYKEIFRLRDQGLQISTVSMNTPETDEISADAQPLRETTLYLDQIPLLYKFWQFIIGAALHPVRTSRCLGVYLSARPMQSGRDYFRLAYHLLEAGYLARELKHEELDHIHSHFINGPTSLGMFTALLLDIPFSFTMHASMIWLDPIAFANKLKLCKFCVSISEYNRRYVLDEYGSQYGDKIHVIHCGVEDAGWAIENQADREARPTTLLAVGQLNARKGFHVLIAACGILSDRGTEFRCRIVGEGEERPELERLIDSKRLGEMVELQGAIPHEQIARQLAGADIFVLPCVVSKDGWRDGIPVALMEAMLNRLPVISTRILGIPELIDDGVDGVLVEPDDPGALAEAIVRLSSDDSLKRRLGEAARGKVLAEFNNEKSAASLMKLFNA